MKCPQCGFEAPEVEQFCPNCGMSQLPAESLQKISALSALPLGTIINGKYHIEAILKSDPINVYRASCDNDSFIIEEARADSKKKSNIITRVADTLRGTKSSSSATKETSEEQANEPASRYGLPLRKKFELLSSLDSAEFQKTLDYFAVDDREYLVLENATGKNLFDIMSEDLLTEELAIVVTVKLCERVERIHAASYVHLNIEPGSIYILDGQVRLFNFERAIQIGERRHEHLTSEGYSAPELFSINSAVDVRADIYSIGAVLYRMISRQPVSLTKVPIIDIMSSVSSPELTRILVSCLVHDPKERYMSASELKEKLATYQAMQKRSLHFDTACITDIGMVRKNNEDSCFLLEITKSSDLGVDAYAVYLIADGMGGEKAGEVASNKAIAAISSFMLESLKAAPTPELCSDLVKQAIEKANSELYQMAKSSPQFSNMGTTVTMGLRVNNELYLGHVGDSRTYLIRGDTIRQITQDHSVVAGLLKAGMITQEVAKHHPERGKIFRCLGTSASVVIDTYKDMGGEEKLTLQRGDSLVFCSDGLTAHVSDEEILVEVGKSNGAYKACERLIWLANQRGGSDNISVIVSKSRNSKHQGDANV
jgi:protein phosphatase